MTIKQLLDAQLEPGSNDTFKIDGSPVSQVRHSTAYFDTS